MKTIICPYCQKKFRNSLTYDKHIERVHKSPIVRVTNKPTLVKCGKHYIDPKDVSSIKEAKRGLFIVKLKSEPNPEWPLWIEEKDIDRLINHFNIEE